MIEPEPAKAVVKTMRLLECLSKKNELGVTELADSVGMHKSTVYRFLNSFKMLGYVRQDPNTERYSLALKLFELGSAVLSRVELWKEAHPVIEKLAEQTQETVHLAVLDGGKLVYLGKIESTQALRVSMMSQVGQSAPTYCTGVGKILLAHLAQEMLDEILNRKELRRYTDNTITDRQQLEKELEGIRKNGYAADNEEHEVGVRCVAAPIRNNDNKVVAALSISMPSVRLTNSKIPHYKQLVTDAAREISNRLGAPEKTAEV